MAAITLVTMENSRPSDSSHSTSISASLLNDSNPNQQQQQEIKPCCACKETRFKRDDCIIQFGEDDCVEFIEAHKACLRSYGFIL